MSATNLSVSDVDAEVDNGGDEKEIIQTQREAPESLQQDVRKLIEEIRKNETDPVKSLFTLHKLRQMYYQKKTWHYRRAIGNVLADCGYAVCTVNMMTSLSDRGYFPEGLRNITSPTLAKTSRHVMDNAWNYSDASDEFAHDLAKANMIHVLLENLKKFPNKNPEKNTNQYFLIRATLSIMCNIARRPKNKESFKKYDATKIVFEFKFSKDNYLKVLALCTLAFIVDAKEAQKVTEDPDAIRTIIHWMNIAIMNDEFHRLKEGFTAAELAYALDKLAVDGNAERIIEGKALKAFYRMLNGSDIKQQINAAKCVWTLAFKKEARKQIKEYKELVSTLQRLEKEETNRELLQNVKGALWVLFDKGDEEHPNAIDPSKPRHLFISYCWDDQETVRRIWQKLTETGYNVWIDIDRMSGDILDAMSSAVENSAVVIICVSEGYKQSQCCHTEAGYAYQRKKGFIPLYMQNPYHPDGWLGAVIGSRLYFDFSGESEVEFEDSFSKLLRELGKQGILQSTANTPVTPEIPKEHNSESHALLGPSHRSRSTTGLHPESTPSSPTESLDRQIITRTRDISPTPKLDITNKSIPIQASLSPPVSQAIVASPSITSIVSRTSNSIMVIPPSGPPESFMNMKKTNVRDWLSENGLEKDIQSFKHIDGKLLWQLKCIKIEAPAFFYKLLQDKFELDPVAILKFRYAIEMLE
ncbi:hypothetical protein SNE40_011688 [Patella caerulea]|uniref:TIR domain-containing protein n=1 Tax=Patella caerulea TaxID=87958 RepID=A0AAN8PLZ1_PATCE